MVHSVDSTPVFCARDTWRQQGCAFFPLRPFFVLFARSRSQFWYWPQKGWVLKGAKGGGQSMEWTIKFDSVQLPTPAVTCISCHHKNCGTQIQIYKYTKTQWTKPFKSKTQHLLLPPCLAMEVEAHITVPRKSINFFLSTNTHQERCSAHTGPTPLNVYHRAVHTHRAHFLTMRSQFGLKSQKPHMLRWKGGVLPPMPSQKLNSSFSLSSSQSWAF